MIVVPSRRREIIGSSSRLREDDARALGVDSVPTPIIRKRGDTMLDYKTYSKVLDLLIKAGHANLAQTLHEELALRGAVPERPRRRNQSTKVTEPGPEKSA